MTQRDDWSPDEPLGTEAFEQGDEALDERARMTPRSSRTSSDLARPHARRRRA